MCRTQLKQMLKVRGSPTERLDELIKWNERTAAAKGNGGSAASNDSDASSDWGVPVMEPDSAVREEDEAVRRG